MLRCWNKKRLVERGMAYYYFGIKISKLVLAHQSIENSPARLLAKKFLVERGVANYYFGINITSTLAQTHQSLRNSQAMFLE